MRIQSNKPLGLVFGDDPKLMQRLGERFGRAMEFRLATPSDCGLMHRMANVRVAVVLWNHQATALAYRIQNENPGMPVLVERNRRGFRCPIEKNGFAATFDKAESREQVLNELENILFEDNFPSVVQEFPQQEARLNLESFLTHLPQVTASLDDESKLANAILTAVLGATRTNQGGVFLSNRAGSGYELVAARNLPAASDGARIDADSNFCIWLGCSQGQILTDAAASPADPTWKRTGCNLILPLMRGHEFLGWFLLKIPGAISGPLGDLLQTMAFFAAEAIEQGRRARTLQDDCNRWQEICSKTTEAVVWVDEDGSIKVLNHGTGILKWKSPSAPVSLSDLRSSHLKSVVQSARDLESKVVGDPLSAKESALVARADSLKSGGVVLTVRRRDLSPERGASVWRRAVLILLSEDRIADHRNRDLLLTVRELVSEPASHLVSFDWIVEKLESNKRKLGLHRVSKDELGSLHLPAHSAARIFLSLADVMAFADQSDRLNIVLSRMPGGEVLTLDVPIALPEGGDDVNSLSELGLLGCQEAGIAIRTAAFGFRLTLPGERKDNGSLKDKGAITITASHVPQTPEIVLQKSIELPSNNTNGIHDGPTVTGSRHRRAARLS